MNYNKVVYFRYIPLTLKIFCDFYMKELLCNGIDVEYWDMTDLFFKDSYLQEDSSYLTKTIKFRNYQDVETVIRQQNLDKTLFISIVTYEGRVIRLYKLFTKYNCKLAVFGRSMIPIATGKKLFFQRLKKITPKMIINYIDRQKAIKLKLNGKIKKYDILFLGGNNGWRRLGATYPGEINSAQKINVNNEDYDNALEQRDSPRIINGDYVLFLDQYLPLHPDTRILGQKSVDCVQYYSQLNSYFDKVEKQFGIPVIIAAHPKALKYKEIDYFNCRKVYFGQSAILSRDAKFVLAHHSTSVDYPIAFNVQLHFITSRSIEKDMYLIHRSVIHFAKYLKCNWQYFDNENEPVNLVKTFSSNAYLNYKYDFMCSKETENKLTKNIFIDFITS